MFSAGIRVEPVKSFGEHDVTSTVPLCLVNTNRPQYTLSVMAYKEAHILSALENAATWLGYTLRDKQCEIALGFVSGRDAFVSLPTGSEKTLCYAVLPWIFDELRRGEERLSQSIVIVVSPLIAVMKE